MGLLRVNLTPQQTRTNQLELAGDDTHRVKKDLFNDELINVMFSIILIITN